MEVKNPFLIVFFSRNGHSEKMAKDLSERLNCETIRVEESFERTGVGAYFTSFNEKVFGSDNSSYLKTKFDNVEQYKAIIFIGPVWWWGLNGPIKNACGEIAKSIKNTQHVFLALSFGGKTNPGDEGSFLDFKKAFDKKAIVHDAYLGCQEQYYAEGKLKEKVDKFVDEVLATLN
ncbi:Flavodoxin-like domain-containing protein [Entamoeba marina]